MKLIALFFSLMITSFFTHAEEFKLPMGTTFRAYMTGFDCGEYNLGYVQSPKKFENRNIEFKQFSADKDLNNILLEIHYTGDQGERCFYGGFFLRNRSSVELDFNYSEIKTNGDITNCTSKEAWLNNHWQDMRYETSKRGHRYVAVVVDRDEQDIICESKISRAVFDRKKEL